MNEKPESSIPDALEKQVYTSDSREKKEVRMDIVFIGTNVDMLNRYGGASQKKNTDNTFRF
ncbi:hypothetical protein ACNUDM_22070 [Vibrio chaetopteri]|uniref:hypothetical protein n=1 Tax=Vibrio chaetopteri TaxID=3016528 RepID=UPI003AB5C256